VNNNIDGFRLIRIRLEEVRNCHKVPDPTG
jgi:hypothetical protein